MKIAWNYLALLVNFVSYFWAVFLAHQSWIFTADKEIAIGVLLCICFLSLLYFHKEQHKGKFLNIEQLFSNVAAVGVSVVVLAVLILLPDYSQALLGFFLGDDKLLNLLHELLFFATMHYFAITLFLFKRLIFSRKNAWLTRQWNVFLGVLVVAAFARCYPFYYWDWLGNVLLLLGGLTALPLLLRVRWVASINQHEKWLALFYLFIISLIALIVLQQFYQLEDLTEYPPHQHVFVALLVGSSSCYGLISLLALIFNMPIASVIEEQRAEIKNYQEINRAVHSSESKQQIFNRLLTIFSHNTQADASWYILPNADKGEEDCFTYRVTAEEIELVKVKINFRLATIDNKQEVQYWSDISSPNFYSADDRFKSLLMVLIVGRKGELEGILFLAKTFIDGFDEDAVRMCKAYLAQTKLALENMSLLRATAEAARYKEEVEIAKSVQQALLPKRFPKSSFYSMAAIAESAKDVGGDYYDYSEVDPYRIAVIVGDVSGKGASAAFHMAQMKGVFQALIQLCLPADQFLTMANQALAHCLERNRFITIAYLLLDFEENTCTYCRAGHCPIVYYSSETGVAAFWQAEGMGLGIIRQQHYSDFVNVYAYEMASGDVIVLYTDGLVEARNVDDEQYGYDRLCACVQNHVHLSADEIKTVIYKDYKGFVEQSANIDDMTLVVVKVS